MRFEDFVLQLDASSRGGFRARVLKSRFGEGTAGFSLSSLAGAEPASQDGAGISRDIVHRNASSAFGARPPLEIGTELFRSVFQGQVRTLLDKSRGQLEISPDLGLRLKIKIDPSDEDAGALADLPWELLCDGETEDFFVLSRQMSLVRYLDVPRSSQPIPFTPPLRILAVGASPRGLEPLDLDEEVRRLEDLDRSSPGVEVRFPANASAGAVREALLQDTYHVLHFMGHGTFEPTSGEGMLAFEKPDGSLDLVSGKAFATKLKDLHSLGVVVLNACNTARARHQAGASPFRGVATALVLGGVPAVVAMQRPISDQAAIGFTTAFYRNLARGDSIDSALTEGRQAIHSAKPEGFEWATPVLFLRTPEGNVFEAKPAERTEEKIDPLPPPPPEVQPTDRATPKLGPVLKIAAGAAGTGLLLFTLKTQIFPLQTTDSDQGKQGENLTTELAAGPEIEETPRQPDRDATSQTSTGLRRREESTAQAVSTPAPTPVPPPDPAEEAPAPIADLSSLTANVESITRREEGGLRVTVSFRNAASQLLSAVLDGESSALSDEQGRRYEIVDSTLVASDSSWRLELAPGASSRHTFDFPAPKLNSTRFLLALRDQYGGRVKVDGASMTLEGPP